MRKKNLHGYRTNVAPGLWLSSLLAYQNAFLEIHQICRSWRKLAVMYNIHPSMARWIALGYDPGNKIRTILHLPAKEAVEVCKTCGKVHTTKRCTSNNHRPRSPRIAVSKNDMRRAADSLLNNVEPGKIQELIELLKG